MPSREAWLCALSSGALEGLDVGTAVRALQTCRDPLVLRPCCIAPPLVSLWDVLVLRAAPYNVLLKRCNELQRCVETVRKDHRFTFHEQYRGCLDEFYPTEFRKVVEKLGSLHGWRPGMAKPERSPMTLDNEAFTFEYDLFPSFDDVAVNTLVALPSRANTTGTIDPKKGGFIDGSQEDEGLFAVHPRGPALMLRGGVLAVLGAPQPLLAWLVNCYKLYNHFWCGLVGYVDTRGDFCLESGAVYGDSPIGGWDDEDYLPVDDDDFSWYIDEFSSAKFHEWDDVLAVLNACWTEAEVAAKADMKRNLTQPPNCIGLNGDGFWTEQFRVTRRFQRAFHRMAKSKAAREQQREGSASNHPGGVWTVELDAARQPTRRADGWCALYDQLRSAEFGPLRTFRDIVGEKAYDELRSPWIAQG